MAFPTAFMDDLRQRVSIVAVVGRRVRLIKKGREYSGLCPFHNEKSPSFTVSDDKGFYHCFGCGVHGDAIEFVRRTEGLDFVEAIERLAAEAGLAVPQPDPKQKEVADEQAELLKVMDAAASWYESQLWGASGAKARQYLLGRALSEETIRRFRLGFAPEGRGSFKEAMLARQIPEKLLIESGMLILPEGGGASYDRFRDRVMFPIADRRGRIIAFGGRAFGDLKPKYLNSPDTPLFHKGQVLYNLALAREASRSAGTVLLVEGYMDVIAMAQAGLVHAMAPLGTALTEAQMKELWRLTPEPIICLDGDTAGLSAALRAAERALPLLEPGRSLRFALLPAGEDPDSLIKGQGRGALDQVLAAALPLGEILWRHETQQRTLDTPERRAALEKALANLADNIADETVRSYYRRWFKDRIFQHFAPKRAPVKKFTKGFGRNFDKSTEVGPKVGPGGDPATRQEKLLLAIVLASPDIFEQVAEEFAALEFRQAGLDRLRQAILHELSRSPDLDAGALARHLTNQGLDDLLVLVKGRGVRSLPWFALSGAAPEDAVMAWRHIMARHRRLVTLEVDLLAAEAQLAAETTPESLNRLIALREAIAASGVDDAELIQFGAASGRVTEE